MNEAHKVAVNKAINYITEHMMDAPDLTKLATIAGFSKFHFHRIFKAYTGETVLLFTKRLRLEQAAFELLFNKHQSIREIALTCGFVNSRSFSTAFKKHFHVSPKVYKTYKGCQGVYIYDPQRIKKYDVKIQYLEAINIQYNRSFGIEDMLDLDEKLSALHALHPDKTAVVVSWDNPEATPSSKCRFDYGYLIEKPGKAISANMQHFDAKTYAIVTLRLDECASMKVWDFLYANWLPRHGYQPDGMFCFETLSIKRELQCVDFYLPIKKQ